VKDVRPQAKLLLVGIKELHHNEAEITFEINSVGELGNKALGKIEKG